LRLLDTPRVVLVFMLQNKKCFRRGCVEQEHDILHLPLKTATTDLNQTIDSIKKIARMDVEVLCFGTAERLLRMPGDV